MKTAVNLADVVNDPDLAQPLTVYRSQGSFELGGWVESTRPLSIRAVVTVASEQDLRQVPEGDRVTGAMSFHSTQRLYLTRGATPQTAESDTIVWRGDSYRLVKVWPYGDYGYYKAIGVRMSGE